MSRAPEVSPPELRQGSVGPSRAARNDLAEKAVKGPRWGGLRRFRELPERDLGRGSFRVFVKPSKAFSCSVFSSPLSLSFSFPFSC